MHVLQQERLVARAESLGNDFRQRLQATLAQYEMVNEVRGQGMLTGIEFQPPSDLAMRLSFEAFKAIHPGLFGQILVMRLFKYTNILTQICGNNFMVLKAAPPLIVTEEQIEEFVEAVRQVVDAVHNSNAFWATALGLARRVMNI